VTSHLDGERARRVGLADEEAVPDPLAELEADAVKEVVRDPARSVMSARPARQGGEERRSESERERETHQATKMLNMRQMM